MANWISPSSDYLYTFKELGELQLAVNQVDVLLDPERLTTVLTLKPRKTALTFVFALFLQLTFVEEVVVGVLQALDGVLKRLTTCFLQPRVLQLEGGQLQFVHLSSQRLLLGLVGVDTLGEEVIEDPATASEVLVEKHLLLIGWVQSELVGVEAVHLSPGVSRCNNCLAHSFCSGVQSAMSSSVGSR